MEISVSKEKDFSVVSVSGRLDAGTAAEFEKDCAKLIDEGGKKFILQLAALEYVSSAGLRSVLTIAKKLKAIGGSLSLCGLSGLVQEVFSIAGFDSFLPIYDTLEKAIDQG